jgi:hypothetical protein
LPIEIKLGITQSRIDNQLHHLPTGDSYAHTSVVQFFDFVNNLRFQVLRKFSELKNLWFWVFENCQNQSASGFGILKIFRIKEDLVLGF